MMRPEAFARLSIVLTAIAFGGFGLWFLVSPQAVGLAGVEMPGAAGRIEIRAFYGGLELGVAAFFALAAGRRTWFRPALLLQVVTLGGMCLGRVLGMLIEGEAAGLHVVLAAVEFVGAAIGAAALAVLNRPTAA